MDESSGRGKKKKAAFGEEDEVDPEEVAKKKKEELKKQQEEQMANARIKTTNKVDLDKKFEERQAKLAGKTVTPASAEETKGMSKAAKGMILEQQAEASLADQLFGAEEVQAEPLSLNTEKEYKDFGKKIADHLYQGKAPYHVDKFFKELTRSLPEHCDSKQIKSMVDSL